MKLEVIPCAARSAALAVLAARDAALFSAALDPLELLDRLELLELRELLDRLELLELLDRLELLELRELLELLELRELLELLDCLLSGSTPAYIVLIFTCLCWVRLSITLWLAPHAFALSMRAL